MDGEMDDERDVGEEEEADAEEDEDEEEEEEEGFSDTESTTNQDPSEAVMNIEDVVEPNTTRAALENDLILETATSPLYEGKCAPVLSRHKEKLNDEPVSSTSTTQSDSRFRKRPTKSRRRRRRKVRSRRQELIHRLSGQVRELKDAISTNESLKSDINERLEKNRKQADALRQELATRANSHERRTLMELEYRVLKVSVHRDFFIAFHTILFFFSCCSLMLTIFFLFLSFFFSLSFFFFHRLNLKNWS